MKSIKIKNYKNLKDFEINSLARVNLIVGRNNVGKSTFLEALSIFASGGNIGSLREILDMRGEVYQFSSESENIVEKQINSFSSLYTERDINSFLAEGIEITSDYNNNSFFKEQKVEIKLVRFIEERDHTRTGYTSRTFLEFDDPIGDEPNAEYGIEVIYNIKNDTNRTLYKLGRNRQLTPVMADRPIPYEYVRTDQVSANRNPELFDEIALTPLEKEIINALRIIDPRIEDINFLSDDLSSRSSRISRNDRRVPFVVFSHSTKKYRLSSMGDGINRVLTIILALLNSKDGLLLIDEFDNGLHYSVQTHLWKIIYKLSEKLNIQVFVTTHSNDCIKSFIQSDTKNKGKLIRLENIDGYVKSVPFNDKERLSFAIQQNIEIR